jgi:hypothetical protein
MLYAVNLIPLRPGADFGEFERFSNELDRPACHGSGVVKSFEVYRVEGRPDAEPASVDVVEVMGITSWEEWQAALAGDHDLETAAREFERLVDPAQVTTFLTQDLAR